ncbi:hypothetical protein JHS3_15030 [Jeongeupia sp. HS-3]|uniref:hypothetical protein n=1 Tax=Jeongeupia sp. HS-3 TaxID=1009682 RepID=UPI0018A655FE|nr:hypothetical protein [Jeongeupia sp. HS-3]BCL75767.1 hypothetical protein JHS3_15030 [Jeongeupia sp. HS-3]
MNRITGTSIIALSAALAGCASPVYNYSPPVTQISFPKTGAESSAYVGDTLVSQGSFMEHDAILVESDIDLGLLKPYTITKGTFLKFGESGNISYYALNNPFEGGGTIQKAALADPPKAIQAYKGENKICGISIFNAFICSTEAHYIFTKRPIASPNSFQQSLIYSGKVGNRIKFGYREFSGNTARPAFNNDVDYDLNESKIVGYKGARIEVIEATNEFIRYRLLANFNTPK